MGALTRPSNDPDVHFSMHLDKDTSETKRGRGGRQDLGVLLFLNMALAVASPGSRCHAGDFFRPAPDSQGTRDQGPEETCANASSRGDD